MADVVDLMSDAEYDGFSGLGSAMESKDERTFPTLDPSALHGVAGELVRAIEPQTEADSTALLIQILANFGSVSGRNAFYQVEADRHYPTIFALLIGRSSKARK